jgi:hypothetical protein
MKQLEQRAGNWTVFIEDPQEGGLTPVKRDTLEIGESWIATDEPLNVPYSSARRIAAEYASHVIGVQDPEVRDRVFVACADTRELERIIVR